MRICYFGQAASIHVRRWAEWFASRGHEILLITPPTTERVEGFRVVHAPIDRAFFIPRPRLLARIRRIVREFRPDLVHAHYVLGYGMYAALSGAEPLVVSAWGGDIAKAPAESFLARRVARLVLRRADLIHVGDEDSLATVARLGGDPSRCFVQAWGVDTKEFSPERRDPGFRASLCPEDELLFVSNRSLEPSFNHEVVLRAARDLAARATGFRIAIAGSGSEGPRLRHLAGNWGLDKIVTFLGRLPPDRMPVLYSSGDVYVDAFSLQVPGHGTSVSLMEAMACGLPPVVAERPGLGGLIQDGVSGFFFRGTDSAQLARIMQELVGSRDLVARVGGEARRRACERGDMERNLRAFEAQMTTLLADRHGRQGGVRGDPSP